MNEINRHRFAEQSEVDMAVKTVLGSDPTVETPAEMLFNISAITGKVNTKELASMLRIDDEEIKTIIDGGVEENMKNKLSIIYAALRIIKDRTKTLSELDRFLNTPNLALSRDLLHKSPARSPIKCLRDGDHELLLLQVVRHSENVEFDY